MTTIELLIDFHINANRQGPGSTETTLKAINFLDINSDETLNIADIGCGSGAQTLILAQHLNANIAAIDLFPDFLEQLEVKANEQGLSEKITTSATAMEELNFETSSLDIIWSEAAIYNMGFQEGIAQWRPFLKNNGFLVVSEISWLSDSRPKEIEAYWKKAYPQISTVSQKIKQLERNGYSIVAYYKLPENCWFENYYTPMLKRMPDFLEKHLENPDSEIIVSSEREEIMMYKKYKEFYGYAFFIAQKVSG